MIDEAKERRNLSDIIGRHTKLRRRGGRELVGLCPFHDEKSPSFEVNDAKGTYYCHGCGASGDHMTYLTQKDGLSFRDAYEALAGDTFPEVSEADRAKQRAEDEAIRAAAIAEAAAVWDAAVPAAGTPAEVYARSRGITMPLPPSIRFARTYAWRDSETGETGPDLPAMICAISTGAGELIGIQRIFLRDGGRAKADMPKPKRSLGRVRGGALQLGPAAEEVIVCEGPEDGLTLAQELPGRSVWVTLGTGAMPAVAYPSIVRRIMIAGQNDKAGRTAVDAAALAIVELGLAVRTMYPDPAYKDWNDQLRGITK